MLDDLLDGYITLDGALLDYGVVLDASGRIDAEATATARAALAQAPRPTAEETWDRGEWTYGSMSWPPPPSGAQRSPSSREAPSLRARHVPLLRREECISRLTAASACGVTAVDRERHAGHVAREVRGEEQRRAARSPSAGPHVRVGPRPA